MAKSNDIVCSMCGDIGFPEKLFQCSRCQFRFQHSYCTNYYSQKDADAAEVCDWCLTEEQRNSKQGITQNKKIVISTDKVKQIKVDREETVCRGKSININGASSSSSKTAGRRYKLLKDVLC
ncbi:Zinc ion-binding protein [Rhynchospora pubera]|uniref:Zinc ion-binding protein n=1 Tax=Rhynchospora pubera TaxID=906938 RepID=A0AAV8G950_9POAL|nr:Zinc ion-binding protein [Rhynchospora pubera]